MKYVSANVRGLTREKWREIEGQLPTNTKVVALQETHCDEERAKEIEWGTKGRWEWE